MLGYRDNLSECLSPLVQTRNPSEPLAMYIRTVYTYTWREIHEQSPNL